MKVDDSLISRLEDLARLELAPEERLRLQAELENILDMVAKMQELDTEGVEPLAHLAQHPAPLRDDEPEGCWPVGQALGQAPVRHRDFFVVPKVVSSPNA
jgi:aspartyl-tRNA(Asn)/glutamyl-tRNA(Gln) amidotransferase subunit C